MMKAEGEASRLLTKVESLSPQAAAREEQHGAEKTEATTVIIQNRVEEAEVIGRCAALECCFTRNSSPKRRSLWRHWKWHGKNCCKIVNTEQGLTRDGELTAALKGRGVLERWK